MAMTPPHSNACLAPDIALSSHLQQTLEQPGYQSPAHFARVLGITWQVSHEEALFIREPPDEHGQKADNSKHSVPGTKRQRHANDQKKRAGIHWMAHQGIGPG